MTHAINNATSHNTTNHNATNHRNEETTMINHHAPGASHAGRVFATTTRGKKETTMNTTMNTTTKPAAECSRGKGDTIKDAIVADLKAAGYNLRQVSVKHKGAYYVTIRDASIPGEQIREIARRHERITRDERTGEILSGGNYFVFVERADGCFPPFEEIARALVSAAKSVKESHAEVIKLSHTYFVTKRHGNLYEVTNSDGTGGRFCYRFDYNDPVHVSGAARAIALHEQDLQYLDGKTPAAECADCAAAVSNAIAPIENAAPVMPPPLPLRYRIASKARNSKPWRIAAVIGAAVAGIYAVLSN